jgi:hypothetical protein
MILCEFNYYAEPEEKPSHIYGKRKLTYNQYASHNLTRELQQNSTERSFFEPNYSNLKAPSIIEYILIYWMTAFIAEEVRQVIKKNLYLLQIDN